MWIEHSFKDSEEQIKRCPKCEVIATEKMEEDVPYTSLTPGRSRTYFVCKNPRCAVEKIYDISDITLLDNDRARR
jgi:hypothetical protein